MTGEQAQYAFSDSNTKLSDLEERQRLLKERVLLIGQNLVNLRDESIKEIQEIKTDVEMMKQELEKIKSAIDRLIEESMQYARKEEVAVLARQMKMFSPLETARIQDVERMIKEALQKR